MSISKRVSTDEHGEPVLTVRVGGVHDIYRFARHLEHGQVEFCTIGRRTLRSLTRRMGRGPMAVLRRALEGDGVNHQSTTSQGGS